MGKGLVCICFTFQIFMSSVEGDNLSKLSPPYKGIPDHLTLDLTSYWRQDCLDRLSTLKCETSLDISNNDKLLSKEGRQGVAHMHDPSTFITF